jgi:hypothetical protein
MFFFHKQPEALHGTSGARFPHLPGAAQEERLPVRGRFFAPGKENFVNVS